MRKLYSTIIAICILGTSMAQNFEKVIQATNVEFLKAFAEKAEKEALEQKAKALKYCEENGYPTSYTSPEGQYSEVIGFDEMGQLQYAITDNVDAARTMSADKVQSFGLPNYNLTGRGFTAGVWDGGSALNTHQEFSFRLALGDNASGSDHATHVSGTIMAQGVNPAAKGMANQASLKSFDWNSPTGEMAIEASNGLLVSNHSWGFINGWAFGSWSGNNAWHWWGNTAVSTTEDFQFGRYDANAQAWDQVAVNAPYFTIVKSSGNQRNENGPSPGGTHYVRNGAWVSSNDIRDPDGPYDCQANMGMAKNMISVGAVGALPGGYTNPAAVSMSGFSSWGPADDGRVKPDLVANGVGVFSSSSASNTSYTTMSGTSMSTPAMTGAILLLQEHYSNVNSGDLMRSETVRGLLIHTCDEAGVGQGPDYAFGWGLANIHKAAEVISNNGKLSLLREDTLAQGQIETFQVYSDGTEPLRASIAWLDPVGTPPSPFSVDDPTPVLVNDLDLRIISPVDTTLPWKLDPANPSAFATKGDNIVDNVEVVEILNPAPGMYTISISHKSLLTGGQQSYALVTTGIKTADSAKYCNPIVEFNSFFGQFTDGSGANTYSNGQDCAWRINGKPFSRIELNFEEFDLENQNDVVNVYNGADANSPLLGSFSGNTLPPSLKSTGSTMYITFHSDSVDDNNQGFLATYFSNDCGAIVGTPTSGFNAVIFGDTCNHEFRFFTMAANYDSVLWYYGDGSVSNTTDPIHTYTYPNGGIYNISQVAYGKCFTKDSTSTEITVPCLTTGLDEIGDSDFTIYPNPNSGVFTLEFKVTENDKVAAEIVDMMGKSTPIEFSEGISSGWNTTTIDTRKYNLKPGIYFLKLESGNEIYSKRLMIQ